MFTFTIKSLNRRNIGSSQSYKKNSNSRNTLHLTSTSSKLDLKKKIRDHKRNYPNVDCNAARRMVLIKSIDCDQNINSRRPRSSEDIKEGISSALWTEYKTFYKTKNNLLWNNTGIGIIYNQYRLRKFMQRSMCSKSNSQIWKY